MARPQNGVNGNIPPSNYGYMPTPYTLNPQVPRNNSQNMYGYQEMSQVISNNMTPQGYSMGGNIPNNIRSAPQMMTQPQYAYVQFPGYTQPQLVQMPFTNNYNPPPYMYQPEPIVPPPQPVSAPVTTRKLNPLVIVDPTNLTDVDLNKFKNQSERKPRALLDISLSEKNELIIEEIKPEKDKEIHKVTEIAIEKVTEILKENEKAIVKKCEVREENKLKDHTNEKLLIEKIKEDRDELIDSTAKETIDEGHEEMTAILKSSIAKIDNEAYSSTQESNNEEDSESVLSPTNKCKNYFLQVDKKESDEMTLKRKLTYDREYLLSIKSSSRSQIKPEKLLLTGDLSEEIIYAESQNISVKKPQSSPTIFNNNDKNSRKPQHYLSSQYSKFPQKMSKSQLPKQINLDLNENQIFERSKSGYLPPQLREKDAEIDHLLELKRNIKCNLNKITPQNFQDCLSEINKLNIKEKEEMSCLISEIFVKAVKEEAYSVTYAQFCKRLSDVYSEEHSFKSQLLKKCQEMFEKPIQDQLDTVRSDWLLKIENETDLKMKSLYESDLEEQVKKAKDKYFGNIRFIGELFLHNLLAGKVIMNCFSELLKGKSDPDALLALCKLMETCGKQIDDKHVDRMNAYIMSIQELSESKELETRIRFKLKDIVDMRQRDWVLRHIQQEKKINPKTIEEQKEEAAAEAAIKAIASQVSHKKSHHNVQSNSVRRQLSAQPSITVRKLACSQHISDETPVLGPAKSNWTSGSRPKSKQRDGDIWTVNTQKFTGGNPRSPDQSPQIKLKNKYHTLGSSTEGSGADSRSSTPPITHPKNILKSNLTKKLSELPSMTDDERAKIIFNDIMLSSTCDTDSWCQIRNVQPIITNWIDNMMEKDVSCRQNIGDFFNLLINKRILTTQQLVDSSQPFFSCLDDLICDIPKLWDFYAQFLERFILDKNSNINFIHSIFKPLIPNKDVAHCLSMTLHAASSRLGHNVVGQVFHKSALKWENFVPKNVDAFIAINGLDFTIAGGATLSSGGYSLQTVATELEQMLSRDVNNKLPNEVIYEYLEEHVDNPTWESIEFTRTITSCFLNAMKNKPESMVRCFLRDRFVIISHFTNNKIEHELEVLRSILNIANELNKDTLTAIYDFILTGHIVSDNAFTRYMSDESFKSEPNFELTSQIISQLYVVIRPR